MRQTMICLLLIGSAVLTAGSFEDKDRGYLGINISEVEFFDKANENGVRVTMVYDDSGAQISGLQSNDIIISFQGVEIKTNEDLTSALESYFAGDVVTIGVKRDGETKEFEVELGERPNSSFTFDTTRWVERFPNRGYVGIYTMDLNKQLAASFGVEGGVMITQVSEDSPAMEAGLNAGDIIIGADDQEIADEDGLVRYLNKIEPETTVEFTVVRKGKQQTISTVTAERNLKNVIYGLTEGTRFEMPTIEFESLNEVPGLYFPNSKENEELKKELDALRAELKEMKSQIKEELRKELKKKDKRR